SFSKNFLLYRAKFFCNKMVMSLTLACDLLFGSCFSRSLGPTPLHGCFHAGTRTSQQAIRTSPPTVKGQITSNGRRGRANDCRQYYGACKSAAESRERRHSAR